MTPSVISYFKALKVMNGGLPMNRFAHKHIGQLTEGAAWPKHEQQSRKHARKEKSQS